MADELAPGECPGVTSQPEEGQWYCAICGGTAVHETAWVDINSGEILQRGNDGPFDDYWCETCHLNISHVEYGEPHVHEDD